MTKAEQIKQDILSQANRAHRISKTHDWFARMEEMSATAIYEEMEQDIDGYSYNALTYEIDTLRGEYAALAGTAALEELDADLPSYA